MSEPIAVDELIEVMMRDLFPGMLVVRDEEVDKYLGIYPHIHVHGGISRVRLPESGTRRPRMREQVQIDIWQQCSDGTTEDRTMVPVIEQSLDDFVPASIGVGGTVMRLIADGPGTHDFNPQSLIVHDLLTVTATVQPASARLANVS